MRPTEITWQVRVRTRANGSAQILAEYIAVTLRGNRIVIDGLPDPCSEETLLDVAEAVRAVRQVTEAGTVETPAVAS